MLIPQEHAATLFLYETANFVRYKVSKTPQLAIKISSKALLSLPPQLSHEIPVLDCFYIHQISKAFLPKVTEALVWDWALLSSKYTWGTS